MSDHDWFGLNAYTAKRPILITDDNRHMLDHLVALFEADGLTVIPAADSVDALRLCRSKPISLVITDMLKPGLSGLELMENLRQDAAGRFIPVIVFTGSETYREAAWLAGAAGFLLKSGGPGPLLYAARFVLATRMRALPASPPVSPHLSVLRGLYGADAPLDLAALTQQRPILIVDDDRSMLTLCRLVLSRSGLTSIELPDPVQAASMCHTHVVSLVLCDDIMPNLSGTDLLEQFRADAHTRHIPFILMSAQGVPAGDIQALDPDGVLIKPFMPKDLLGQVERLLTERYR